MTLSSARAALHANGGDPKPPSLTGPQLRLPAVRANPHLKNAARIWCGPNRSWPQLYRILEEIEHVKKSVAPDWCNKSDYKRFTHTANSAQAAGIDARHAEITKQTPPKEPMTLSEAESFMRGLLDRAFEYAASRTSREAPAERDAEHVD
jgi:hypothetical protein